MKGTRACDGARPSFEILPKGEGLMIGVAAHHISISHRFLVASAMFATMTRSPVRALTHLHAAAAALCVGDADAAEAERADECECDQKFVSQSRGLPRKLKLVEHLSSTLSQATSQ
jgi:hypothetical protein